MYYHEPYEREHTTACQKASSTTCGGTFQPLLDASGRSSVVGPGVTLSICFDVPPQCGTVLLKPLEGK